MRYLTNFYRDTLQKELKKMKRKSQKQHLDLIEFKIACDVIESVNAKFYDVTRNFELDFWPIG